MKRSILCFILLTACQFSQAQSIGIGTSNPNSKAALEISSTNKGLLIPRLSNSARTGMSGIPKGLLVYDTTAACFYYHDGSKWRLINEANPDSFPVDHSNNPEVTANLINTPITVNAISGILYDAGGPGGPYNNNTTQTYSVNSSDSSIGYKVTIEEMNLADTGDSLEIFTSNNYNDRLVFKGTTTGTWYFMSTAQLVLHFGSNSSFNAAGFKVRWSQLTGGSDGGTPPGYGWYVNNHKLAVRGGVNVNNSWDAPDIGKLSLAFGEDARATGYNGISFGNRTLASGESALATGLLSIASGKYSTAMGATNAASGDYTTALGHSNTASGSTSLAAGNDNTASGFAATTTGSNTIASGYLSLTAGIFTEARSYASIAMGRYNDPIVTSSTTTWVAADPLFIIGNGTSGGNRANALMVLKNGNTGIGLNTPNTKLQIDGGVDANLTANSGYLILGDVAGTNLVFDNNEIIARNNGANATLFLQNAGGAFEVGGSAAKPGGGSWSASSDARLKQNIKPYKEGLAQLLRINPVSFQYNELSGYDRSKNYIGVIAQELKEVAPYMVGSFNKNGTEYLNVDNSAMTYMLINAVKEQQVQIDELKAIIRELQKK